MQKWEYLVLSRVFVDNANKAYFRDNKLWYKEPGYYWDDNKIIEGEQIRLNKIGEEGYELVCIIYIHEHRTFWYYFKRLK